MIDDFHKEMDYWIKLLNQPNLSDQTIALINNAIQQLIKYRMTPQIAPGRETR